MPENDAIDHNLTVLAANRPCRWNAGSLQFEGNAIEQARCLLRPNLIGGVLGDEPKRLPEPLETLIGREVAQSTDAFRSFLKREKINEDEIGGLISEPLVATTSSPDRKSVPALYFVIHDTSTPYLGDEVFPVDMDTNPSWRGNNLQVWKNSPVAHVFINRLGESITTTPFSESVRKGWGTKFARDYLKSDGKALQLHIELVQPRRRDPRNANPKNDLIAPTPGFTELQYRRLAIVYFAASVRRQSWLIPAFHSAIDAGIADAHDDPQNFELKKFCRELLKVIKEVKAK